MRDKEIRILSTRPLDEALVNKAFENQIIVDSISFIKTEDVAGKDISEQIQKLAAQRKVIVFTSINAAKAVIKQLKEDDLCPQWKIYCINGATESYIKENVVSATITATGKNARELSETIIKDNVPQVTFFCGDQRRDELLEQLFTNGIKVEEIVVYKTTENPVKVKKRYDALLFFSPSAVKSFFSVNTIDPDTVLFSIGDTTGAEIKKRCKNQVIISDFPSKEKLVEIATEYFNTKGES